DRAARRVGGDRQVQRVDRREAPDVRVRAGAGDLVDV
ncbi:MAG: hypothetical protein AVDCRST_MAG64-848, partial [uncultured Phycisphaerae bacterium]